MLSLYFYNLNIFPWRFMQLYILFSHAHFQEFYGGAEREPNQRGQLA